MMMGRMRKGRGKRPTSFPCTYTYIYMKRSKWFQLKSMFEWMWAILTSITWHLKNFCIDPKMRDCNLEHLEASSWPPTPSTASASTSVDITGIPFSVSSFSILTSHCGRYFQTVCICQIKITDFSWIYLWFLGSLYDICLKKESLDIHDIFTKFVVKIFHFCPISFDWDSREHLEIRRDFFKDSKKILQIPCKIFPETARHLNRLPDFLEIL